MKIVSQIVLLFVVVSSCITGQPSKVQKQDSKTVEIILKEYFDEGFLVKDSLSFLNEENKKELVITMVKENERELEFENMNDSPVKRLLLLLEESVDGFNIIFHSKEVLPSLGYGERSDIGYYNLKVQKDIISFHVLKLPYSSNFEYDIKYIFSYDRSEKAWLLSNCIIEKLKGDDSIESYSLSSIDYGNISLNTFNIYEFNPFVYLNSGNN